MVEELRLHYIRSRCSSAAWDAIRALHEAGLISDSEWEDLYKIITNYYYDYEEGAVYTLPVYNERTDELIRPAELVAYA